MSDINAIGVGNMLSCFGGTQVLVGPQGPEGPQGDTGPQGLQGIQGPVGPQGPIGLQGPQGPMGPQGPAGADGVDGTNGVDGAVGPQGPQGIQGEQGIQGPQGPMGVSGAVGAQGNPGPGVSTGGTIGQVLSKLSSTDYDTGWVEVPTLGQIVEATGYGIISGGQVTAQGTPDMTVSISECVAHMPSGLRSNFSSIASMQIDEASTTSNRLDLIYLTPDNIISCAKGSIIADAIAGKCTYTVTNNAVAGDTAVIHGITFTCVESGATGNQFNVGADIAATVTNLQAAIAANTTINALFTVSYLTDTITLEEIVPGGGNTPYNSVTSGTIVMTSMIIAVSTEAVTEVLLPAVPSGCLPLAKISIAMNSTSITPSDITDLRVFKKLHKVQSFSTAIDVNTGTATATKDIVFPNGAFESTPVVNATITTDTIGNPVIAVVKVTAKSTTGCTLLFNSSTNATATGVVNVDIIATTSDI